MRAGGKHNDLENVGYTRRHHTFFEMLGNFSFGDYFKADAIAFAWELITKEYGLPKDRLYVTVFREDDDAEAAVAEGRGRIERPHLPPGRKGQFLANGRDRSLRPLFGDPLRSRPEASDLATKTSSFPSDAGGRFVEIWNLVFMQFDRDTDGKLEPLPRPSIDTGMGLERIAAVMQDKLSNYDTDLICPIIHRAANLFRVGFGDDPKVDTALTHRGRSQPRHRIPHP